jgi:hypothetical protein
MHQGTRYPRHIRRSIWGLSPIALAPPVDPNALVNNDGQVLINNDNQVLLRHA